MLIISFVAFNGPKDPIWEPHPVGPHLTRRGGPGRWDPTGWGSEVGSVNIYISIKLAVVERELDAIVVTAMTSTGWRPQIEDNILHSF